MKEGTAPKITESEINMQGDRDYVPMYLAAITALAMSFTIAGMVFYWRSQIGSAQFFDLVKLVALTGALTFLPTFFYSASKNASAAASLPVLSVLGLFALICAIGHFWLASLATYTVVIAAWCLGLKALNSTKITVSQYLVSAISGVLLGFEYFFVMNSGRAANVFTPEAALLGLTHIDTLFHSSVASLLSQYGIVTTGLDGLVPIVYHALSHLWIGTLGLWLGIPTIYVYSLVPQIIGAPLLVFSVFYATFALWRPAVTVSTPFVLIAVPLMIISLFETMDWFSYLVSESYLFSLVLFLLTFPILFRLSQCNRVLETPLCLAAAFLAIVVVSGTKISVGAILGAAVAGSIFMQFLSRKGVMLLTTAGVFSVFIFVWLLSGIVGLPPELLDFAQFIKMYPEVAYLNIGVTTVSIACFFFLKSNGSARISGVLAIGGLSSLIPTLILNVGGGAQYYFVNVGVWIGIVGVTGLFILPMISRLDKTGVVTVVACLIFVAATLNTPPKRDSIKTFLQFATNLARAAKDPNYALPPDNQIELRNVAVVISQLHQLTPEVERSYGGELIQSLKEKLKPLPKKHTIIYMSPSATKFWHLPKDDCRSAGFLIPAFLGIPLVDGVPASCEGLSGYGYEAYGTAARNRQLDDQALCAAAQRTGFTRILRVDSPISIREIACIR